jgi:plasmid stabilization system protein ParE
VNYRLDIREDALADIETAAVWYEEQQPALGADFARAVRRAINTLPANPLIHRVRDRRRNVRWFLPPRFPYRIVYRLRKRTYHGLRRHSHGAA